MSFEHGIQFAIQRGQASRYKEYPTLVALSSTTMSDGGSRNSDVTVLVSVLQVLVLALTLVTMAGETNGEEVYGLHCWRQEAAGADRTAPAGREFDSVSPCVVSRHAAPSIFLPGLSSPLLSSPFCPMPHLITPVSLFLPFSWPSRAFPFALLRFLPPLSHSIFRCRANVSNIVDSISSQPPAADRNAAPVSRCYACERNASLRDSGLSATVYDRESLFSV